MRSRSALFAFVLAGCSIGGTSPSPAPSGAPPLGGYAIVALGDDFTVGLGTMACGTQTQSGAPCATSPAQAGAPQQIGANANNAMMQTFAVTFAANHNGRSVTFVPLGVNGALSGKLVPAPESPFSGNLAVNPAQLPALASIVAAAHARSDKVLILVFSGVNDVLDAAFTRLCPAGAVTGNPFGTTPPTVNAPCTASGTTVSDAQGNARAGILFAEYVALFAGIAQSNPDAVLYATVWDLSRIPATAATVPLANALSTKAGGETMVQLANDALGAAGSGAGFRNVVAADLYAFLNANPTYLTDVAYFAPDAFHFTDQGYKTLASYLYQQFAAALPGF
ncbi:MAG TPA: SGNH/GDSL hydrolase family protein [Candidatus Binatia bacterium]|nr:SGNH/GDSL hydrolase family protein [Candidatus Binatia bacterium]